MMLVQLVGGLLLAGVLVEQVEGACTQILLDGRPYKLYTGEPSPRICHETGVALLDVNNPGRVLCAVRRPGPGVGYYKDAQCIASNGPIVSVSTTSATAATVSTTSTTVSSASTSSLKTVQPLESSLESTDLENGTLNVVDNSINVVKDDSQQFAAGPFNITKENGSLVNVENEYTVRAGEVLTLHHSGAVFELIGSGKQKLSIDSDGNLNIKGKPNFVGKGKIELEVARGNIQTETTTNVRLSTTKTNNFIKEFHHPMVELNTLQDYMDNSVEIANTSQITELPTSTSKSTQQSFWSDLISNKEKAKNGVVPAPGRIQVDEETNMKSWEANIKDINYNLGHRKEHRKLRTWEEDVDPKQLENLNLRLKKISSSMANDRKPEVLGQGVTLKILKHVNEQGVEDKWKTWTGNSESATLPIKNRAANSNEQRTVFPPNSKSEEDIELKGSSGKPYYMYADTGSKSKIGGEYGRRFPGDQQRHDENKPNTWNEELDENELQFYRPSGMLTPLEAMEEYFENNFQDGVDSVENHPQQETNQNQPTIKIHNYSFEDDNDNRNSMLISQPVQGDLIDPEYNLEEKDKEAEIPFYFDVNDHKFKKQIVGRRSLMNNIDVDNKESHVEVITVKAVRDEISDMPPVIISEASKLKTWQDDMANAEASNLGSNGDVLVNNIGQDFLDKSSADTSKEKWLEDTIKVKVEDKVTTAIPITTKNKFHNPIVELKSSLETENWQIDHPNSLKTWQEILDESPEIGNIMQNSNTDLVIDPSQDNLWSGLNPEIPNSKSVPLHPAVEESPPKPGINGEINQEIVFDPNHYSDIVTEITIEEFDQDERHEIITEEEPIVLNEVSKLKKWQDNLGVDRPLFHDQN